MNVQVMYVTGNFSILTFCDWDRLFSLILTLSPPPYTEYDYEFAQDVFESLSLNVESIKDFSLASMVQVSDVVTYFLIFLIVKCMTE